MLEGIECKETGESIGESMFGETLNMSCVITILDVRGVVPQGSSSPDAICVRGTAEGNVASTGERCKTVIVETDCFKPGQALADVDEETGEWEVCIPYSGGIDRCNCNETTRVTAKCAEDTTCEATPWIGPVRCEVSPRCPDVYGITITPGPCQDGTRRMTLEATVWPNGDFAQWYKWEFGDPSNSEKVITPSAPGDEPWPSTKTSFNYPAPGPPGTHVEYTATFTVVGVDAGCSNTRTKEFEVEGCDGPCPTIKNIRVEADGCTDDETRRTVLIEAEIEGGGVTQYIWDFGDGSAPTPTTSPSTSHNYVAPPAGSPDRTYHGKLTIHGPSGCPDSVKPFDVTVTACADRPRRPKKKCPWWNPLCWFRGLKDFFKELKCSLLGVGLALLIALYIIGVAYCGAQDWERVLAELTLLEAVAAVVAVAVGTSAIVIALLKYQDSCGPCRLGTYMLIGVILAVVAIIILAWYNETLPPCILPAVFLAVGFFAAALERLHECEKRDP